MYHLNAFEWYTDLIYPQSEGVTRAFLGSRKLNFMTIASLSSKIPASKFLKSTRRSRLGHKINHEKEDGVRFVSHRNLMRTPKFLEEPLCCISFVPSLSSFSCTAMILTGIYRTKIFLSCRMNRPNTLWNKENCRTASFEAPNKTVECLISLDSINRILLNISHVYQKLGWSILDGQHWNCTMRAHNDVKTQLITTTDGFTSTPRRNLESSGIDPDSQSRGNAAIRPISKFSASMPHVEVFENSGRQFPAKLARRRIISFP